MNCTVPIIILLITVFPAVAGTDEVIIIPYGDYPHWHSAYGICKQNVDPKEAEDAIERYFEDRGMRAENFRHFNRFTEADIYKNDRLFDRILFDRKTGRLRSIY